ncbi:MAG: MFS transporter [Deltaproteobacteria bacterium]|nr:MFS transporter [Deltaproteobacteria bacterium]
MNNGESSRKLHAWLTLAVCSLLYMVNYMDRVVFSVALEPMKKELGLTDSEMGIIGTVFLLGIAFFALPAGIIMDRWRRAKAIGLMAIFWSLFTWLTGLGRSFLTILLPRAMVGIGEAGFSAGGPALISAAFKQEMRSRVMGIFNMFIMLGIAIGMLAGGKIVTAYGWRTPFFVFAVPGFVLGVIAFFLKDYKTEGGLDREGRKIGVMAALKTLLRIPTLRWLFIGYAMQNVLAFSYLQWTPAFLERTRGLSSAEAGKVMGLVSFASIFGALIGGFLADRWQKSNQAGRMLMPALTMAVMTLSWTASVALEFEGAGFITGILFGVTLMMGLPAMSSVSQDVVPSRLKATSWAMCVLCMYLFGGGWAPYITGAISDSLGGGAEGLKSALLFAGIGGAIASVLLFMGSRHYKRDSDLALAGEVKQD